MVTQKDVAKVAGVSFITVSRVVNNEPNVKEETRLKVQKAIKKLGYFPTFAGRALNSGMCNTIAVLTPISFEEDLRSAYLVSVLSGIDKVCQAEGSDIILKTISSLNTSFDYLQPFRQRKVDGIIYVGLQKMPKEMLEEIRLRKLPCVVIGDRPEHKQLSWVDTDNVKAGFETTKKIWEHGHRRIMFYGLDTTIYNANVSDREKGFRNAIKELSGSDVDESMIIRSDYSSASALVNFKKALDSLLDDKKEMPTAIFCATDNHLPPVIHELKRRGISVPKDFSLVGFDGFFIDNYYYDFSLASNIQPLNEMGVKATEILFQHIKDNESPCENIVFDVTFFQGDSLLRLEKKS